MDNNTTVKYSRRDKQGYKNVELRAETWHADIGDFGPSDRFDGFAVVDIHADLGHKDAAEIRVKDFTMQGDKPNTHPFYCISIGGTTAVTVYLSPEQTRVLFDALETALGTPRETNTVRIMRVEAPIMRQGA